MQSLYFLCVYALLARVGTDNHYAVNEIIAESRFDFVCIYGRCKYLKQSVIIRKIFRDFHQFHITYLCTLLCQKHLEDSSTLKVLS